MLTRAQHLGIVSAFSFVAVIYAVFQFNVLFSHCPTISCICGNFGFYSYVWLEVLALISAAQIIKHGMGIGGTNAFVIFGI
jgi:hypothetical protein